MDFLKRLFGLAAAPPEAEPDMIGWVVLSNTYVELTVDRLRATLDQLYPGQFLPPGDRNFVIEGGVPDSQFTIQQQRRATQRAYGDTLHCHRNAEALPKYSVLRFVPGELPHAPMNRISDSRSYRRGRVWRKCPFFDCAGY
jgi:hypothetical protein